jgi:acyl CoA:acetate/3-ketoacid CoA transferase beta subunit
MSAVTRAEVCVVACAEAFRGDGEILASPMGLVPSLGARLARATFERDLVLTDGVSSLVDEDGVVEGTMSYAEVFDTLWWGRRHVMMGATQIDRFGNQNISCIGDWVQPKVQLLGVRGAPGNTINHATSYWVPNHNPRVFVQAVDLVCGVGYDRAASLSSWSSRFHEIRRVITNLGVFDFHTTDRSMRLVSAHPGVSVERIVEQTGFALTLAETIAQTRLPTEAELALIRERLDPDQRRESGVAL